MEKFEWTDQDGDTGMLVDASDNPDVHGVPGELIFISIGDEEGATASFIDADTAPKIIAWMTEFFKL